MFDLTEYPFIIILMIGSMYFGYLIGDD